MTIKEKLLQILDNKGVSEYRFYKETGVSRGTLANKSGLNADTLSKFFDYFPDIDANLVFRQNISTIDVNEVRKAKNLKLEEPIAKYFDETQSDKEKIIHLLEEQVRELKKDKELLYNIIKNQKQ